MLKSTSAKVKKYEDDMSTLNLILNLTMDWTVTARWERLKLLTEVKPCIRLFYRKKRLKLASKEILREQQYAYRLWIDLIKDLATQKNRKGPRSAVYDRFFLSCLKLEPYVDKQNVK